MDIITVTGPYLFAIALPAHSHMHLVPYDLTRKVKV